MSNELLPAAGVFRREEDPEEVRDRDWSYKNSSQGRTGLRHREMHVPTGDSPKDFAIRQHEMLHAAWSPIPDGRPDVALLAAEDARIETLATRADIDREKYLTREDAMKAMKHAEEYGGDLLLAGYAVASVGSPHEEMVRGIVGRKDILDLMNQVEDIYKSDSSPDAAHAAAALIRKFEQHDEGDEFQIMLPAHGYRSDAGAGDEERRKQKGGPSRSKFKWDFDLGSIYLPPLNEGEDPWSIPVIETPPLERTLVDEAVVKGRKPRWRDTGAVPGAMHRLTTDSKVFRERKRARGGTVLIDMSGSMDIDPEEIERFIEKVPAGIVAGYWGEIGTGKGVIRVMAAEGKAVERHWIDSRSGGANEVDLPAIEWLAKQPGPRFWVCDGGITVKGDHSPSTEQQQHFWSRIRTLGISWVKYPAENGKQWPEAVQQAISQHR